MAQSDTSASPPLTALIASLVGIALGLVLTRALPLVPSTLLNALVLAGGARISRSCRSPSRWWALIGAATGTLIGNGWVLTLALQQNHPAEHLPGRLATVLVLCGAGAFAGQSLGRPDQSSQAHRRPGDLLRSASSLTAGVFAALVTVTFIHGGLDVARAFSSRLSTSLTILVVSLAAPGWLTHRLREPRHGHRGGPVGPSSPSSAAGS